MRDHDFNIVDTSCTFRESLGLYDRFDNPHISCILHNISIKYKNCET